MRQIFTKIVTKLNNLEKFKDIDTFVFDVDGVMTDNKVLVLESGRMLRTMNVRDGLALKFAIRKGYMVGIITGGRSQGVIQRLQGLGVAAEDIYVGVRDKKAALNDFLHNKNKAPDSVLYMGDDMPDLEPMRIVGLSTCPADAIHQLIKIARYVSPYRGGEGCVRDVVEKVLTLRGDWNGVEY